MLDKKLKSNVIEAYVKLFEEDYTKTSDIEKIYDETVEYVQRMNLEDITEQDVAKIGQCLLEWGNMWRVLGRREHRGWEKKLKDLIKEYSSMLVIFRKESSAKVEQFEGEIKEIYGKFRETLGPTAAGKTLNILCPDFFPLWDTAIKKAFNVKDDDYYAFMLKVRGFIKKYDETFTKLAKKYNKKTLRIFDEFAWQISNSPISLFSNDL